MCFLVNLATPHGTVSMEIKKDCKEPSCPTSKNTRQTSPAMATAQTGTAPQRDAVAAVLGARLSASTAFTACITLGCLD